MVPGSKVRFDFGLEENRHESQFSNLCREFDCSYPLNQNICGRCYFPYTSVYIILSYLRGRRILMK